MNDVDARPLTLLDRLLFGVLCVLVGVTLAGPIRSGDMWWHLRTGHWILEQGRLPDTDPFSHTAGDTHWILQEYGTQVLFALVDGPLGLLGLRALGAILGVALLAYTLRSARRVLPGGWAVAATALFAALFALKWELRPHLLSAFFVLRFHALLFDRQSDQAPSNRTLIELFLLSILWVQLHAEALFGPIFAFAGWLGAVLTVLVRRPPQLAPIPHLARWTGAFLATLSGTLISPLGVEPHVYALFRRSVPKQFIEEWFPSWILPGDPRFVPLSVPLFALIAASLVGTGLLGLIWGRRRFSGSSDRPRFEALGFLGTCGALALDARRFFWLLYFPLREWLGESRLARAAWVAPAVSLLSIAVLARTHYPAGAFHDLRTGNFTRSVDPALFPVGSADVVAAAKISGNLYHPYEWGGYLGWRLGDANPVFIDGRTVLFEDVIPERWRAERDPAYAAQVFADRDVRVIVFKRFVLRDGSTRPWRPPGADTDWVRAHADATSEVWLRADQEQALERLRDWYATEGAPFDPDEGFVELAALAGDERWRARRLLPEAVLERLDPGLAALRRAQATGDAQAVTAAWTRLAEQASQLRIGRSARYASARAMDSRRGT